MSLTNNEYMSKGEQRILQHWKDYEKEHNGESPTLYQAAKDLGYGGHGYISKSVNKLVKMGFMQKKQVKGRMGNTYSVVSFDSITRIQPTDSNKD